MLTSSSSLFPSELFPDIDVTKLACHGDSSHIPQLDTIEYKAVPMDDNAAHIAPGARLRSDSSQAASASDLNGTSNRGKSGMASPDEQTSSDKKISKPTNIETCLRKSGRPS